jgi:hypothetical protein
MKMTSRRWNFERSPVAQHRPQYIDPSPGQSDEGLGVPLAFRFLAIVEGAGARRLEDLQHRRSLSHLPAGAKLKPK